MSISASVHVEDDDKIAWHKQTSEYGTTYVLHVGDLTLFLPSDQRQLAVRMNEIKRVWDEINEDMWS